MLSIETRERLVRGYERTHNAKMITQAYGVSERDWISVNPDWVGSCARNWGTR